MFRSLSSLFLSSCIIGSATAGTMGPTCTSVLCAMDTPGGFYLGMTGIYGQPAETGLGLAMDSWLYNTATGTEARGKPFEPNYKWLGDAKVGYDIPGTANNAEIHYLFLNNGTHRYSDFADGSIGFGSIFFPDFSFPLMPDYISDALLIYKLNQVDGKVGRKYSDVSGVYYLRPSVGIRWAELTHSLVFAAPGEMIGRFRGTGPLFSLEGRYGLPWGLGLTGYFDYAFLIGQANSHSSLAIDGLGEFGFFWPKRNRVVNAVSGKIGLDYVYTYYDIGYFTLEGGYQVNEYFNALDTIRGTLGGVDGIQRINAIETNSFSFQGPYISLSWHA